jgi:hypothetical protein
LPLAEIQERLFGKSDAELETILGSVHPPPVTSGECAEGPAEKCSLPMRLAREVVIAPGLKLVADEGWVTGNDPERLVVTFRAALAALRERGRE